MYCVALLFTVIARERVGKGQDMMWTAVDRLVYGRPEVNEHGDVRRRVAGSGGAHLHVLFFNFFVFFPHQRERKKKKKKRVNFVMLD